MQQLLSKAFKAGIRFEADGESLRVIAPEGALTEEMRTALRQHSKAILALLKSSPEVVADEQHATLEPDHANRLQPFPLNEIQHAYWLGRQRVAELGGVSTHMYFELDAGQLDLARFNAALCRLIERHDMLRAVIDDNGMQRILPEVSPYRIEQTDLSRANPGELAQGINAIRQAMSHQVLPSDRWSLFAFHACSLPERQVRLHVSLDFLIVDAWSVFMLFREWHQLYEHPDAVLPAIDIAYRDYVLAEKKLHDSDAYRRAHDYWMQRIDSLPDAPDLPVRTLAPGTGQSRFSRRCLRVDKPRWDRLKARAQAVGLTSSNLLLAAFSEVLARWSATPHFSLNLTIFNRLPLHAQVNRLVGDFTSLLLVEVDQRDDGTSTCTSFGERAQRLQRQMLDDLDHREMSGVEVMREWSKRRGTMLQAAMPVVFTSALVLGGEPGEDAGLMEAFGPIVYGITQTPQVWLDHQAMEFNGALVCNWDAVDAMFEEGVLDAMFAGFAALIDRLIDDEGIWERAEVAELPAPMLELIQAANATEASRCEVLLHAGFIAQARATPDAVAIVSPARTMSYRELLAESAAVAAWLKADGIVPGQTVAVLMHKGWEQVVAVLGILMAGGAYVPVDADLPKKRQQELLQIAGGRHVLVQAPTIDTVATSAPLLPSPACGRGAGGEGVRKEAILDPSRESRTGSELIEKTSLLLTPSPPTPLPQAGEGSKTNMSLYEVRPGLGIETADDPVWLSHPTDQLAYVIFTSGTTGVPKGVMIDHRGAVNTVLHVNSMFKVDSRDSVLAVSSLSFDLSVYDIFGLLAAGGSIVIPDAERNADPEHWLELIAQHGVTLWNSAPPLMTMLTSYMDGFHRNADHNIRLALLSGDWIPVTLKSKTDALLPNARMISLGGATEASVWSIWYPIDRVEADWKSIPYGKALPNQTMHVLNERLQPCPFNVTGEIYIGGIGLALGYLNDAEKTGRHFITHPDSGEHLYRTGDLGRMLADGNIEFLGRRDTQIKLRGHRIELGEIAATLRSHPAIKEALVTVDGDSRSEQTLWAYLQLDPDYQSTLMMQIDCRKEALRCTPAAIGAAVRLAQQSQALAPLTPEALDLWDSLDTLYFLALIATFKSSALFISGESHSIDDMMVKMHVASRYRRWLKRAADFLVEHGILTQQNERFAALAPLPDVELHLQARDAERRLMQVLSLTAREAAWFTHGAEVLADILSEKIHSAELYTADETALIYQRLFADSHTQLRQAATALAASAGGDTLRVLEVGAGLGSATGHLLPALAPVCARYDFTDLSTYFLKKAQEKFSPHDFIEYRLYDLEQPPADQGFELQSYDLIVASSVLHNVSDLGKTLASLRHLLAPGGLLMLLEETRFLPSFDLTMGLPQGFDVFTDESIRRHHPMVSRQRWRSLLESAGFPQVELLNVEGSAADHVGFDVIVAQVPAIAHKLEEEALNAHLLARLPAYMKPTGYQVLAEFPTTANGKIDYRALALSHPIRSRSGNQGSSRGVGTIKKPANAMEQKLLDIWRETLGQDTISTASSFFDIGGDSLLLVEVRNHIKQRLGLHVATTMLFEYPSITALAQFLSAQDTQQAGLDDISSRAQRQRQALKHFNQKRGASQGAREHV